MESSKLSMEELVSFAKRRGFVFQASEIYGGLSGFWDYGPLGVELANNIKTSWWRTFVYRWPDVVGIDSAIIQNPRLWQASGHTEEFVDPMVDDKVTKKRYRADHLAGIETSDLAKLKAALAGKTSPDGNPLTEPKLFNLMFTTQVGPIEDEAARTYLRPETAGGIFVNFKNVSETTRLKLPFGIAQIGKSFRNEITPGDFIFRVRELEIMEFEYFCRAEEADTHFESWLQRQYGWFEQLGLARQHLHNNAKGEDDRAHYSAATTDIEFDFPFGTREIAAIANRTDYDLKRHMEFSGRDLSYYDETSGQRIVPYVIEPTFGVGRLVLAVLCSAYHEEEVKGEQRVVLRLPREIAPVKVSVLPLSKKPELSKLSREVFDTIAGNYNIEYDETQSIGRRYRRQDEIGTPFCVTVDFDSLKDQAVTVRDRDSMSQERIKITELKTFLAEKLSSY